MPTFLKQNCEISTSNSRHFTFSAPLHVGWRPPVGAPANGIPPYSGKSAAAHWYALMREATVMRIATRLSRRHSKSPANCWAFWSVSKCVALSCQTFHHFESFHHFQRKVTRNGVTARTARTVKTALSHHFTEFHNSAKNCDHFTSLIALAPAAMLKPLRIIFADGTTWKNAHLPKRHRHRHAAANG